MSKTNITRLKILTSSLPPKAAGPVGNAVLHWLEENVPEAGEALHQKLRWLAYHRVRVAVEKVLEDIQANLAAELDDFIQPEDDGGDERSSEVCGECGGPVGDTEYKPFCSRACQDAWQAKADAFKREGQG